MTANRNFLRKKYARVIEEYARIAGCSLDEAMDRFYRSQTYALMRDGVSDMHCMSENYLAEELADELKEASSRQRVKTLEKKKCFCASLQLSDVSACLGAGEVLNCAAYMGEGVFRSFT